ncbi:MAG: SGNH/GDSL hydrolase family protein [Gemmatimonadales bacterium]
MVERRPRPFERYVAIGDSSTEGLDDRDPAGGYRGWSLRLASRIASEQGTLAYANLGVRGKRTVEIRSEQLEPALAMRPDLVTLFTGTNDVVGRRFDPEAVRRDVLAMHRALIDAGATVLTFTLPDITPVMPLARAIAHRVEALNEGLREASAQSGAILVDIARFPVASDPRLWSEDRLHANSLGHERIAAALAEALGLPGTDGTWSRPLPSPADRGAIARLGAELSWTARYLVPWIVRSARGRSSGDGITCRYPSLIRIGNDSDTREPA